MATSETETLARLQGELRMLQRDLKTAPFTSRKALQRRINDCRRRIGLNQRLFFFFCIVLSNYSFLAC